MTETTQPLDTRRTGPLIDPLLFARGMAVIRIFFGIVLFANGVAKLHPEFGRIDIGAYHANLITREGARRILNFEVNERQVRKDAPIGTQVPYLKRFVNNVILKHWSVFDPLVMWTELIVGAALILGLATRLSALIDLGFQLFLALVYFSSNRWMFEQPHEYVPLIVLVLVPAGRVWGLDGVLIRRNPNLERFPF
jgi:uncharacterized membrane protein YphA (DoxX/SURF4 family)